MGKNLKIIKFRGLNEPVIVPIWGKPVAILELKRANSLCFKDSDKKYFAGYSASKISLPPKSGVAKISCPVRVLLKKIMTKMIIAKKGREFKISCFGFIFENIFNSDFSLAL